MKAPLFPSSFTLHPSTIKPSVGNICFLPPPIFDLDFLTSALSLSLPPSFPPICPFLPTPLLPINHVPHRLVSAPGDRLFTSCTFQRSAIRGCTKEPSQGLYNGRFTCFGWFQIWFSTAALGSNPGMPDVVTLPMGRARNPNAGRVRKVWGSRDVVARVKGEG